MKIKTTAIIDAMADYVMLLLPIAIISIIIATFQPETTWLNVTLKCMFGRLTI